MSYFVPGDVRLQCNGIVLQRNSTDVSLVFSPLTYYFFRCDVIESGRLQWLTPDASFTVGPFSQTGRVREGHLNVVVESIEIGQAEFNTNFTSYIWFFSDDYRPDFIMCRSDLFSTKASFMGKCRVTCIYICNV